MIVFRLVNIGLVKMHLACRDLERRVHQSGAWMSRLSTLVLHRLFQNCPCDIQDAFPLLVVPKLASVPVSLQHYLCISELIVLFVSAMSLLEHGGVVSRMCGIRSKMKQSKNANATTQSAVTSLKSARI